MINAAYDYLNEGFSVLPLKENKAPMLETGHPYLYQLMDENDIEKYFLSAKKIGIACGEVSGGLECIDFDAHDGENIRQIFNEYMKDDGVSTIIDANNLPIIKTMNGGYHILYRTTIIEGSQKLARWENGNTMIETRGQGSYIATIPSGGYSLIKGSEIVKLATISDEERDYLLITAENFTKQIIQTNDKTNGKWPDKFDVTTAWGKFNENGEDEIKDLLLDAGWSFVRTRKQDGTEMWLRPGKEYKTSKPVSATYGKLHNMFYCFSSNAEPFKERVGYTHFDILMLLKFKGNKFDTIKYLENKYNIVYYKPKVTKKTIDFPLNAFPELIKCYIEEQNKIGNFDKNLMSSTFLWLSSTLIGNRFSTLVNDNWNVSPVMWLMIIAERGSTKTHAINAIISSAKKRDNKKREQFEKELKEYNPDDKTSKRPIWKQTFLEDGTREGFIKAMNNNPGGLGLMKDELTGWIADMDKHSGSKGGDEAFWLSSFNNTSYTKNIKGDDGSHINRMFINLAGSIQPGLMNELIQKHTSNGLFDRFLLVPYKEKKFKFSMKKPEVSFYKQYVNFVEVFQYIMEKFTDGGYFVFNPDAELEFEKCYNNFLDIKFKDDNTNIRAYLAKIITYLPRLSLVMEIIGQINSIFNEEKEYIETRIGKDAVIRSYDILKYFLNNARNLLAEMDNKKTMYDIIRSANVIKNTDKARILLEAVNNKEIDATQVEIAEFLNMSKQHVNAIAKKVNKSKQK